MTKLLHDILREPAELAGILSRVSESRWEGILAAAGLVRSASPISLYMSCSTSTSNRSAMRSW